MVIAPVGGGAVNGSAGDDLIVAGPGNDLIDGGGGANTVSYDGAAAGVKAAIMDGPQKTSGSGIDTLVSVQDLIGSDYADTLKGGVGNNILVGGAGIDALKGMDGDDLLAGGTGNDSLAGGSGIDTASYFDAPAAVTVNLTLKVAQDTGGGGIDLLSSIENLTGSEFDDRLTGDSKANRLVGGLGNDILIGGGGADMLYGGDGADQFVFLATADSKVTTQDQIMDFSSAQNDRIDLSQIDAIKQTLTNDAFSLVTGFTHAPGQLVQHAQAGGYLVQGDVNGDGVADFAIFVHTTTALTAADFIL